jgi:hypothetical protein
MVFMYFVWNLKGMINCHHINHQDKRYCRPERKNSEIIDYQSIFCQYKSEVNGASWKYVDTTPMAQKFRKKRQIWNINQSLNSTWSHQWCCNSETNREDWVNSCGHRCCNTQCTKLIENEIVQLFVKLSHINGAAIFWKLSWN